MADLLSASTVCLFNQFSRPSGGGILVAERTVITATSSLEGRNKPTKLNFPLLASNDPITAHVSAWEPASLNSATQQVEGPGLAVLELDAAPPTDSQPAQLMPAAPMWGNPFRAFGYAYAHPTGKWITGKVQGKQINGWFQMRAEDHVFGGADVFEGAPVWDEHLGGIIGIMTGYHYQDGICSMAPTELLQRILPSIQLVKQPVSTTKGSVAVPEEDMGKRPTVFVGSSVEALVIANEVHTLLDYDAEVTVWNQGAFQLSSTSIKDLVDTAKRMDFGIFVLTPDDIARIRDVQHLTVRDNVLFELGLFIGALGQDRCFLILPRNTKSFHLPTDLLGINPATYDPNRSDKNLTSALSPACNEIRKAMGKKGRLARSGA